MIHKIKPTVEFYLGILVFVIAVVQTYIAVQQSDIAQKQQSLETMAFTREYINGYTYLYDHIPTSDVAIVVTEIRKAGLPALAVPSQYRPGYWAIVAPSFGDYLSMEQAKKHILGWRVSIERREKEIGNGNTPKIDVFKKYQRRIGYSNKGRLVFFYKADIVTKKDYFEELAQTPRFFVNPAKI